MIIIQAAIDIRNLYKRFVVPRFFSEIVRHPFRLHTIEALRQVNLRVAPGSIVALLGPNGAGKTTLLRVLSGTVRPDRGTAHILGFDVVGQPVKTRERVGFVLADERSFFWRLTALQNLNFFATLANLARPKAKARIREIAHHLSLEQELPKPFRSLSTGMRQRLSMARALLHDPDILLVDEPTRGLDPGATKRMHSLIRETLSQKLQKTILLTTHRLSEADNLADQLALLQQGSITLQGSTAETLPKVRRFFCQEEE